MAPLALSDQYNASSAALPELDELHALVIEAADLELLPRFADVERALKRDGSVVTSADLAMQQRLAAALRARWPEYHLLGEEMAEREQRRVLEAPGAGLWCLDPLDGTSNFAAGVPYFAVSLALIRDGGPVLGLVYDPIRRECFAARRGAGAWLNGAAIVARESGVSLRQALAAVDFKRLPTSLAIRLVEHPPYSSQRSFGAVALDWCWLAAGRYHVYLHGRQQLWDYAAGWLVLQELGGQAMTLKGNTVFRADGAPRSVAAALERPLFEEWVGWLGIAPHA